METLEHTLAEHVEALIGAHKVATEWGSPHLSVTPIPIAVHNLAAQIEALKDAVREIALEVQKLSNER